MLEPRTDAVTALPLSGGGAGLARRQCPEQLQISPFERVELTARSGGVHVLPVLSWATVERIAATSRNLRNSVAFKRAVLSRPEPITATGDEQIVPPLRAIKAMQTPQPPW
jgi:hypothetical protein